MICPRCADAHIELMATSAGKRSLTVYQCQHCLYTARYRTVTPYQPRTLSTSVSHDAKDIDDAPMVPSIPPLLAEDKR